MPTKAEKASIAGNIEKTDHFAHGFGNSRGANIEKAMPSPPKDSTVRLMKLIADPKAFKTEKLTRRQQASADAGFDPLGFVDVYYDKIVNGEVKGWTRMKVSDFSPKALENLIANRKAILVQES